MRHRAFLTVELILSRDLAHARSVQNGKVDIILREQRRNMKRIFLVCLVILMLYMMLTPINGQVLPNAYPTQTIAIDTGNFSINLTGNWHQYYPGMAVIYINSGIPCESVEIELNDKYVGFHIMDFAGRTENNANFEALNDSVSAWARENALDVINIEEKVVDGQPSAVLFATDYIGMEVRHAEYWPDNRTQVTIDPTNYEPWTGEGRSIMDDILSGVHVERTNKSKHEATKLKSKFSNIRNNSISNDKYQSMQGIEKEKAIAADIMKAMLVDNPRVILTNINVLESLPRIEIDVMLNESNKNDYENLVNFTLDYFAEIVRNSEMNDINEMRVNWISKIEYENTPNHNGLVTTFSGMMYVDRENTENYINGKISFDELYLSANKNLFGWEVY